MDIAISVAKVLGIIGFLLILRVAIQRFGERLTAPSIASEPKVESPSPPGRISAYILMP